MASIEGSLWPMSTATVIGSTPFWSALVARDHQITEFAVLAGGKDRVELRLGDDLLSPPLRRLLEMRDRRAIDIALLHRPVHRPLDRAASIPLVAGCPFRVRVHPGLKVVRPEVTDPQILGYGADEGLAPNLVMKKPSSSGKPWEHPGELKGLPPGGVTWQCGRAGQNSDTKRARAL